MVDYKKTIGTGDEMMIRDTGSTVEFWFHSDASTWNNEQAFAVQANGSYDEGEFVLSSGGAWHKVASRSITTNQDVLFRMFGSGLGWPTSDFWVSIDRVVPPSPPSAPTFQLITRTSVRIHFTDGANNGSAIDARQISGARVPTNPLTDVRNANSGYVWSSPALDPGETYYFWARTHNAKGWSPWGPRGTVTTHDLPAAPDAPVISAITQTSVKAVFTDNSLGGVSALERQIGYGTSSSAPTDFVSSNNTTISGLDPGKRYYFWSRVRNTYGWGPWSARVTATLIAGAWVNDDGVWKRAVPYVRAGGVWKVARPWVKKAGVWKETST